MPNTDSDAEDYCKDLHRAYYRALFDSLLYGVCRTDEIGKVQEANQAFLTMMGCDSVDEFDASELITKVIGDANERARIFETSAESKNIYTELDLMRKDGAALPVRVSGRTARDEEGNNQGYLVVIENRNEQRAIEAQLRSVAQTDALTGPSELPQSSRCSGGRDKTLCSHWERIFFAPD
jgi:PAS domain S-box-containing protein